MGIKSFVSLLLLYCFMCFGAEFLPDSQLSIFDKQKNTSLKYWNLSYKGKNAVANIKGKSCIEFNSNGGQVIISGKNFRLRADNFKNGNVTFFASITGSGESRYSFYCYNLAGKFIKSFRCGSKPFGSSPITVNVQEIPKGTVYLIPVLTLTGKGVLTNISCGTPSADNLISVLPKDFSKRSISERIKEIDSAKDYHLPLAVLFLKDTPEDKEYQVRFRAAYKLGLLGVKALPAAETLASQLTHRCEAVRVHSAAALTKIGKGAYPFIKKILLGNNIGSRLCMANTVRGMPGGIPLELAPYVKWASPPLALSGNTLLPDSSFEASKNNELYGWQIHFKDGATGYYEITSTHARTGRQALKLVKTNGKGYILLVSSFPVTVPINKNKKPWIFRLHYQCNDASYNTLLLPRFIKTDGSFQWHDTRFYGGAGWQSQSLLTNTYGAEWNKRLIIAGTGKTVQPLRPAVVLYGNPTTVYLDDLDFPAQEINYADAGRTYSTVAYTKEEMLRKIKNRPIVNSKLEKTANEKVVLKLNGKITSPVFMLSFNGALGDYEAFSRDANIQQSVITVNMRSSCRYQPFRGILDSGKLDFSPMFEIIESALQKAPNSSPILGINVAFPDDFVKNNPQEAYLNEKGVKAYGTQGVIAGFSKNLPKGENWVWWPSQFSSKARAAAGEIIQKFLAELMKKPYAKVFSGVFISGGHDGQFFIPYRDFGPAAIKEWRKFLTTRYGTDVALQKAWNNPNVTVNTAKIPPIKDKFTLAGNVYDPSIARCQIDFKEFEEQQIWKNSGYYLELCKAAFGRDILGFSWCLGGTWSQNLKALYHSKAHDFFAAQPTYHYRPMGYSGGLNMVANSNRIAGKLAISELDLRSWLRGAGYFELYGMKIGTPLTSIDMRNIILKESGRMLAAYQGLWFYDMGNGTFRAPESMKIIKTVKETADWVFRNASKDNFKPDTVWITSQLSHYSCVPSVNGKLANHSAILTEEMMLALRGSGVYPATMFLSDLMKNDRYRQFKVFVFLNPLNFSKAEHQFIREKLQKNGNTIIWCGGTGYPGGSKDAEKNYDSTGISVKFDSRLEEVQVFKMQNLHSLLTGVPENIGVADSYRRRFVLDNTDPWQHKMPRWIITDSKATILANYSSGGNAIAVKKHANFTTVFCGIAGLLDPVMFYNIVKAAGAYTVTTPGAIIDMNGNFLSMHALKAGKFPINMPPGKDTLIDVESGKKVTNYTVTLKAGESRWFKITSNGGNDK